MNRLTLIGLAALAACASPANAAGFGGGGGGGSSASYYLDVAKSEVSGATYVNKFGRNDAIDSATPEEIWSSGGLRVLLSSAETLDVTSNATADSTGGTGALTLYVEGLDASYNPINETVNITGSAASTTSQAFLRLFRAFVVTAGTGATNAGIITIDPSSSGSGSRQATIGAGDGQTLIGHYTVPATKDAYLIGGVCSVVSASSPAIKQARIQLFRRDFGGAWRLQEEFSARSDGGSPMYITPSVPIQFGPKTDLKWLATVDNNGTSVYVRYTLIMFPEA